MNNSPYDKAGQRQRSSRTTAAAGTDSWRMRLAFWLLLGIAAFYLITEHGAHLLQNLAWLPFLLILACPLIHLFGHGHHGGHGSHDQDVEVERAAEHHTSSHAPTASVPDRNRSHGDQSK